VDVKRNKVGSLKKQEDRRCLLSLIVITLEMYAPALGRGIIPPIVVRKINEFHPET
jgi:hypothetical protein